MKSLTTRDGRIGPWWEHFAYHLIAMFLLIKGLAIFLSLFTYVDYRYIYIVAVVAIMTSFMAYRQDIRDNQFGIEAEVNQTVPNKFFLFATMGALVLNVIMDFDLV